MNHAMFAAVVPIAALTLSGCSNSVPPVATDSPRLTAELERTWQLGDSPGRQALFSGDGALLATSNAAGSVTVLRTSDWKPVRRFDHSGGATSVAFTPDRRLLLTAGYDGLVRSWDLATGQLVRRYAGATGTLWSLDVSPDGTRVAAAGEDAIVRVWPLTGSDRPITLSGHERNIWEVRFSRDGSRIATASFDTTARIWDSAGGKPLRTLRGHSQAVVGLDFSPDGKTLATGGDDSTVRLWRTTDGAALQAADNGNHAYKIAFSSDGRWLVSAGRARGVVGTFWHRLTGSGGRAAPVHLWRARDLALVHALPHPDDVLYAAFSPNGRWLVTSGEDGRARLWRITATD